MRWGIETFYGYVKEELQLGQFSGIRDICIRQDFAANLFLFNLQSLIEKQCEPYIEQVCKTRIYKYKVNKKYKLGIHEVRSCETISFSKYKLCTHGVATSI